MSAEYPSWAALHPVESSGDPYEGLRLRRVHWGPGVLEAMIAISVGVCAMLFAARYAPAAVAALAGIGFAIAARVLSEMVLRWRDRHPPKMTARKALGYAEHNLANAIDMDHLGCVVTARQQRATSRDLVSRVLCDPEADLVQRARAAEMIREVDRRP